MSAQSQGAILPFAIGTTWSQNGSPASTDAGHLEGLEFVIPDLDYTASNPAAAPRSYASNGQVGTKTVRVVRNVSTVTLVPKKMVTWKSTAIGYQVDGYSRLTAQEAYPVDEFLPYNVPINDLFYITVEGKAAHLTSLDADATNLFTAGDQLVTLTAAASTSTSAGRVAPQDLTGATSPLALQVQNRIGAALSTKTTANTNADVLVHTYKKI